MYQHLLLILGLYIALGFFEIGFPAERNQKITGRLRNLAFQILFLAIGVVMVGMIHSLIPIQIKYLPEQTVYISFLITFVYIFVTDFIFYWYHRAEHKFEFFWYVHELHHSDAELNTTTSMRTHWLEQPFQTLLIGLPISYIIGIDERAALMLPVIATCWLFFAHANWKLELGFLTPIICGPQVHRIHHSNLPEHENKNFAQFFPVIDIVFGTYYAPHNNEFPPTGTSSLATNVSMREMLIRPFQKWKESLKSFLRQS